MATVAVLTVAGWLLLSGDGAQRDTATNNETAVDTIVAADSAPSQVPVTGVMDLSIEPGGDVYLDDVMIGQGTNSVTMAVDTGSHVLRIVNDKAERRNIYDTIQVHQAGVAKSYKFTFPTARPEAPTAKYGTVVVGSNPKGADIFIDGELQGQKTNYTFNRIETGSHTFRVMLDGRAADTTLVVKAGGQHKVRFDLNQ
jgi:hypothetical protein